MKRCVGRDMCSCDASCMNKPSKTKVEIMWSDPEYKIYKDGDNWCAIDTNTFIDLAQSEVGFGLTPGEALANLLNR